MKDGLATQEIIGTDMTATNLSGTNVALGGAEIGSAEVGAEFATISNGSPVAYGNGVQVGNATSSAGSSGWVVFGNAFAAAPEVITTGQDSLGTIQVVAGSLNAGSFFVLTENASETFSYMAIGSGRV